MKSIKSFRSILWSIALIFITYSCAENPGKVRQTVPDGHTSQLALDWAGVYRGVLPCADCEGIQTKIMLKRDGTFHKEQKYLGKDEKVFLEEGEFAWDDTGSRITLKMENDEQQYQVGENVLFHLDREGLRITGDLAEHYKLFKNLVDPRIEDKKWVLFELRGSEVELNQNLREGFIQFSMETGSFSGNNTCNNFFGSYELFENNKIKFGPAGSTQMACPDMETEKLFMEILEMADNYTVADNILSLNKARMAPLARFRFMED